MSRRRTRKQKLAAQNRRKYTPTIPSPSFVKKENHTSSASRHTPPPTKKISQNKAISPHTLTVRRALTKTLLLTTLILSLEVMIYWLWHGG